jgi:hypothetical protein
MPTHPDLPEGWQEHARRRSREVTEAVERARAEREAAAPRSLAQLAREQRERLTAEDRARSTTSVPPPGR